MPLFYPLIVDDILPDLYRHKSFIAIYFDNATQENILFTPLNEAETAALLAKKQLITQFMEVLNAQLQPKLNHLSLANLTNLPAAYVLNDHFWLIFNKLLHTLIFGRVQQGKLELAIGQLQGQNQLHIHFLYDFSYANTDAVFEEADLAFVEPMSLLRCHKLATDLGGTFNLQTENTIRNIHWLLPTPT